MTLKRIRSAVHTFGALDGFLYLAHRALTKFSGERAGIRRYYLVAQPVPATTTATKGGARANPVRLLGANDQLRNAFPRPQHVIAKRFRDGNLCFGTEIAGRFAGFLWIARKSYDEDEVRCLYELAEPDSSAWDYDIYVEPEFRLGRTFTRLWNAAHAHLAAEGVRWTFSRISGFNPVSLQAHMKLGIQRLFSVTFVQAGIVQFTFSGVRPYFHLSLSPKSRPILRLSPPK